MKITGYVALMLSAVILLSLLSCDTGMSPSAVEQNALRLDGVTAFAEIKNSQSLSSIDSACTLEAWVKPVNQYYNTVLSKGSGNFFVQILLNEWMSFLAWNLTIDYSGAYNYWGRLVTPIVIVDSAWTHMAVTFSKHNGIKLYSNGILLRAASSTGVINAQSGAFRIGARDDTLYTEYFKGDIDEVRVWNIERSEQEIRASMSTELSGNETGLVGYWKFNETNTSQMLRDESGQSNHLTIHGNAMLVKSSAF